MKTIRWQCSSLDLLTRNYVQTVLEAIHQCIPHNPTGQQSSPFYPIKLILSFPRGEPGLGLEAVSCRNCITLGHQFITVCAFLVTVVSDPFNKSSPGRRRRCSEMWFLGKEKHGLDREGSAVWLALGSADIGQVIAAGANNNSSFEPSCDASWRVCVCVCPIWVTQGCCNNKCFFSKNDFS